MQPRPRSGTVASVLTAIDQRLQSPLDVDSFAESLLMEDTVNCLALQLAAMGTVKKRKGFVDAQKLSKNWRIGTEAARRTVEATTQ